MSDQLQKVTKWQKSDCRSRTAHYFLQLLLLFYSKCRYHMLPNKCQLDELKNIRTYGFRSVGPENWFLELCSLHPAAKKPKIYLLTGIAPMASHILSSIWWIGDFVNWSNLRNLERTSWIEEAAKRLGFK